MRIYKGNADLVFRGLSAPWYLALAGAALVATLVLAVIPGVPAWIPLTILVAGAFLLWPVVVRNRVELYKDRLEIVFGWGRTIIPYEHVRDVRRVHGVSASELTSHNAATTADGVFVDAPHDGDALVSVLNNDSLVTELRRRAGLDAKDASGSTSAGAPPRQT